MFSTNLVAEYSIFKFFLLKNNFYFEFFQYHAEKIFQDS